METDAPDCFRALGAFAWEQFRGPVWNLISTVGNEKSVPMALLPIKTVSTFVSESGR